MASSAVPHPMLSRFMHPENALDAPFHRCRDLFIPGMAPSGHIVPMIAFRAKQFFIEGSLASSCNCRIQALHQYDLHLSGLASHTV